MPVLRGRRPGRAPAGPTLLYGYGGFEISLTPDYSGVIGRGWLARGGSYVVANIRGGGEYGPQLAPRRAAGEPPPRLRGLRRRGRGPGRRGITTPERLGIEGGSNGGLLMGVMLTRYPELFGAVVCAGAAAGHAALPPAAGRGLVDGRVRRPGRPGRLGATCGSTRRTTTSGRRPTYPPVLFITSTRDDRVHPGHARKMAARLREHGHDVAYYENIEGGHGAAADNEQRAFLWALTLEFLWLKLAGQPHTPLPRQVSPDDAVEPAGRRLWR